MESRRQYGRVAFGLYFGRTKQATPEEEYEEEYEEEFEEEFETGTMKEKGDVDSDDDCWLRPVPTEEMLSWPVDFPHLFPHLFNMANIMSSTR